MLRRLTPDEIVSLLTSHPEQSKFDCKRTLNLDSDHAKAEFVKDVVAVANAHGDETGYLLYGIDLRESEAVVGLTDHHDDAALQQLVNSKVERPLSFIYDEVDIDGKTVGVVLIPPSSSRPHIARVNFASLRQGDIKIRRGSTTTWASWDDLRLMFGEHAGASTVQRTADELLRKAADPSYPIASLALETWQLASRTMEAQEIEWLRREVTGYARPPIPDHREVTAYASAYAINPFALAYHNLDSIASLEDGRFTEVQTRLGFPIDQLEQLLSSDREPGRGVFYGRKTLRTKAGGSVEGYVYYKPDSVRAVLVHIKTRILDLLMKLREVG